MKNIPLRKNVFRNHLNKLDHRDLVNSSFWVGQIFVLIATVIGVFLAAQTGLKQAIEFDNITGEQNVYYLQKSLHGEVSGNLELIDEFIADLESGSISQDRNLVPTFYNLVWENMRFSSYTLEIPSKYLLAIQKFYGELDKTLNDYKNSTIGTPYAKSQIKKLVESIRPTLNEMNQSLTQKETVLLAAGIEI